MTDETFRLSRRKALAALGTVGVASAGAGLGTSAFFSDQETFENNQLTAGTLDLKAAATHHYVDWLPDTAGGPAAPQETDDATMAETPEEADLVLESGDAPGGQAIRLEIGDAAGLATGSVVNAVNGGVPLGPFDGSLCETGDDAGDAVIIDLDDVKPGDFGIVRFGFAVCDNPAFLWFNGALQSAAENGVTEPEADDPDEEGGTVELLDAIRVAAVPGDAADALVANAPDAPDDPTLTVTGEMSLRSFLQGGLSMPLDGDIPAPEGGGAEGARDCFSAETNHRYSFLWWLPVDHANEIQSDAATFSLGLYAEQCRHNDGATTFFTVRIENVSGPAGGGGTVNGVPIPLSPGVYAVHGEPGPLFTPGSPASPGLEDIAEDGMPSVLLQEAEAASGVRDAGAFALDETVTDPNQPDPPAPQPPIFPGGAYEFGVMATPGDALSFATMFIQSNDLFYAPGPDGIDLFDPSGDPVSGDVTAEVALWDASTEDDQEPGLGDNQAPRQAGLDTGPADTNSNTVELVDDVNAEGYTYPPVADVIRVTVEPQ